MSRNRQKRQAQDGPGTLLARALVIGFIGGVTWSIFGVTLYYFNFSEVAPKTYLLRSWLRADWTDGWLGDVVSILLVGILSVLVALIYYGLLKKANFLWVACLFGIVLWFIVFIVAKPIFPNVYPVSDLHTNTIVSTACLYILYGAFIGYSISYDYHDTRKRK